MTMRPGQVAAFVVGQRQIARERVIAEAWGDMDVMEVRVETLSVNRAL